MPEIFQVYNSGNKCFVKMCRGRVLENAKDKFAGIPMKSDLPGKTEKNEAEILEQPDDLEPDQSLTPPDNEKDEKMDKQEDSKASYGFFDWD